MIPENGGTFLNRSQRNLKGGAGCRDVHGEYYLNGEYYLIFLKDRNPFRFLLWWNLTPTFTSLGKQNATCKNFYTSFNLPQCLHGKGPALWIYPQFSYNLFFHRRQNCCWVTVRKSRPSLPWNSNLLPEYSSLYFKCVTRRRWPANVLFLFPLDESKSDIYLLQF